jgi:hypothetical protein
LVSLAPPVFIIALGSALIWAFRRMRVARGLFRLWIVISVIWIGGVVGVTWWIFPPAELTDQEVDQQPEECHGKSKDECKEIERRLGDLWWDVPFLNEPERRWNAALQYVSKRRSVISFAALAALVPPLVLLILGGAFGWAFRGFRSEQR